MPDIQVRPSTKLITPFYWFALLLAIASVWLAYATEKEAFYWLLILPAVIILWAVMKHLELRFIQMTVSGLRLRYETGILSKSTRTIEVHKVQDVRVDQSLFQRMLGMGNISIETAGETSRLTMRNIDQPHKVAEQILEAAQGR